MLDIAHNITEVQPQLDWFHARYIAPLTNKESQATSSEDSSKRASADEIERALSHIPPDDYETWICVGMALKAGGCERSIWDRWSAKSEKYNATANAQKWESFKSQGLTLGTIFYLAQQNGAKREDVPATAPGVWTEPILFESRIPERLSPAFLPKQLRDYVLALSEAVQVPSELVTMLVLAAVATAAQRRFIICPFDTDYIEPVNIWTITVLPPGSRKSEILKRLTRPLSKWAKQEEERIASINITRQIERDVIEMRIDKLKKAAANSKEEAEREALTMEAAALQENLPKLIVPPRLFTGDVTPEELQNLLVQQGGRMAILADEGGIFEVMSGLYTDGKVNIDVFMQSWSGSPCMVDRGARQVTLLDPALSFGLTVQQQIINDLSQGSKRKFRGIGCLARFLYALPKSNIGSRNVRKISTIPSKLQLEYESLINSLLEMEPIVAGGEEEPRTIKLTPEAQESLLSFAEFIERRQGEGKVYEPIQDWTSKLPGQAARITALCHIINHGLEAVNILVPKETIDPILEFCKGLISHAQAAFDNIGADPVFADAKYAYGWIQKNYQIDDEGRACISENDLYKSGRFRNDKMERCRKALDVLKERGIVSQQCKVPTGGRDKLIRYINPALVENFQGVV